MYTLERTKKMKAIWGCMTAGFFGLSVCSFLRGGAWMIFDGHMDAPLASIVMIVAFFASILSLVICLTIHALEKDMADHLRYLKHQE